MDDISAPKGARKRPPTTAMANGTSRRSHRLRAKRRKGNASLCLLELLPTEILTEIFLLVPESALPQSSAVIGAKLSQPQCYHAFLTNTFCYFRMRRESAENGGTYEPSGLFSLRSDVEPSNDWQLLKEQNQALRFRWLTWSVFQGFCLARIKHLKAKSQGRIYQERLCIKGKPELVERLAPWPSQKISIDFGAAVVPPFLLRWPLTPDRLQLLCGLNRHEIGIDWIHTCSGEQAIETLERAVKEKDWNVLDVVVPFILQHDEGWQAINAPIIAATDDRLTLANLANVVFRWSKAWCSSHLHPAAFSALWSARCAFLALWKHDECHKSLPIWIGERTYDKDFVDDERRMLRDAEQRKTEREKTRDEGGAFRKWN